MEVLLEKTLIISAVCVGLRMASSKRMFLYFLRLPYDLYKKGLKEENKYLKFIKKSVPSYDPKSIKSNSKLINDTKRIIIFHKTMIYILKPLIGCVTCMASTYTLAIDWFYYGQCDRYTALLIFMVACLNTLAYALFEKLSK